VSLGESAIMEYYAGVLYRATRNWKGSCYLIAKRDNVVVLAVWVDIVGFILKYLNEHRNDADIKAVVVRAIASCG
jgi:hypothetical protein